MISSQSLMFNCWWEIKVNDDKNENNNNNNSDDGEDVEDDEENWSESLNA